MKRCTRYKAEAHSRILDALAETLRDPALLAEARKQSLPIELFSAKESEKIIATIYAASPELVRKVREIYD